MTDKYKVIDAVQALVVTAVKWIESEFPKPEEGVEQQTLEEVIRDLNKANTALCNLLERYRYIK